MSRSKWKGFYIDKFLFNQKFIELTRKKIWSRKSTIPSFLIGKDVYIHNGNKFIKINITREKVGYKFGEFALTRKFTKKEKKNKKKNKK